MVQDPAMSEVALSPFENANDELEWLQQGVFSREHRLFRRDRTFAVLREGRVLEREAQADAAGGGWVFQRPGWFSREIVVLDATSRAELGRFVPGLLGNGRLRLTGGSELEWRIVDFWRGVGAFVGSDGEPVIAFRPRAAPFRGRASVTFGGVASRRADLGMLAALGWHLMLGRRRRSTR